MGFKLGARSVQKLTGVDPKLVAVVTRAIEITKVDFAVVQGLRTLAEQKKLVASGASQTMNSKHLTGDAVDLMAMVGSRGSWELNLYDDIADAMKAAAIEKGVGICWGAAWNSPDIRKWSGTMEAAMNHYVDERRSKGKRPFLDCPHFQLAE